MSLARWDPFSQLATLEREINRLFRRQFAGTSSRPEQEALITGQFAPPVDIYEDEKKLTFKMEVPGIDPKDLEARVEGNTLTVNGERKFEKEEKKENFRRVERGYGSFSRSFTLPPSADPDSVKAEFNNGILQIDVAKRAEAQGKQIRITERAGASEQKKKAA